MKKPFILIFFVLQASLNWLYVLWVKYCFVMLVNAWFALVPLIGFFYLTFLFIASCGLYKQKQFGFGIALGVLLFGAISAAISYMLVGNSNFFIGATIVPLFISNFCIALYMGKNRDYFRGE